MKMKYGVIGMIWFMILFGCAGLVGRVETMYTIEGRVISAENEEVIIQDINGNEWLLYDDVLEVNDKVKMTMYSNMTDGDVTDDTIERVKKIK